MSIDRGTRGERSDRGAAESDTGREGLITTTAQHRITCGRELAEERASKYDYRTEAHCQKFNRKGLPLMAVGVNKSAELYVLAEKSQAEMASGKCRDQCRRLYGRPTGGSAPDSPPAPPAGARTGPSPRFLRGQGPRRGRQSPAWTQAQRSLAMIYNARGLRPDEIAAKMRISSYLATQMVQAAKNRGQ